MVSMTAGAWKTTTEVPRMSRANTYPTGKEPCEFIRDPDGLTSAPPLTLLYKTVHRQGPNGVVKTVEPNNFFYYSRIVGDGALKHLSIEQSNNFFGPSLTVHAVDIFTYTIEAEGPCFASKILGTSNTSFLISLADGVEYIIRVRYKPLGLKGYDLPESTPLGGFRYDFKTKLDGITVGVDAGGTLLKYLPN